jgi:hypothetical protein
VSPLTPRGWSGGGRDVSLGMPQRSWLALAVLLTAACDRPADGVPATCGLASIAAATTLLEQFTIPDQTLSQPPATLPERTVVRIITAGALPAVVGRTDSLVVIGVQGNPPPTVKPGFGVLVVNQQEQVEGVAMFEGNPITGAPRLGEVSIGSGSVPLIGVQFDPAKITDPSCPSLFPDSVIQ